MLLLIASTVVLALYMGLKLLAHYVNSNNDYWPKLGVPRVLVSEFGTYLEIILGKKNLQDLEVFYYNRHKEAPYVGIMELNKPVLMVRDMELVKKVVIKDFEYFVNRRMMPVGHDDFVNKKFLFNMNGQHWKDIRAVMSPTFSTGKIRRMFDHFSRSSLLLAKYIKSEMKRNNTSSVELRETFGRYTMDIVASTAFGMDSKCFSDSQSSVFLQKGKKFLNFNLARVMKTFMVFFVPKIAHFFKLSIFDREAIDFFHSVGAETIKKRRAEKTENQFTDFISLMMMASTDPDDLGNQKENQNSNTDENFKFDSESSENTENSEFLENSEVSFKSNSATKITDDYIVANSIAFFLAGFDVTESVISFATYLMATHPEYQIKVYNEIQEVIKEFGGEITYDGLNKMNYLEMFMSEVTRLYPPSPRTERKTTKDYRIPDSNVVVEEGTLVVIPILSFHRDEKYFPEPEKFDPERFSPENKASRPPYAYMPFGHGPRFCIGQRFAMIATKGVMAQLVHQFEMSPCQETFIPMRLENSSIVMKPAKGLKVAFKPRF